MFWSPYFIFFCFLTCHILQLNAFDEEDNDIFAELWQKSEEIGTKAGKCEETLQTSNENFQKIGKIKKEIVVNVKEESNDNNNNYEDFRFDKFSNERQQKIALNKIVKEENVEKWVKSEFMEFDSISDKEEFDDNGKDGEEHNDDIFSELWQKSEEIGTKSVKCEETLRTNSNDNLISQKILKIKKEIVVKDEPHDYDEFDQFSNERQQKIALNKTVKEENVEKRVKSEEFDDNGKDGEEQSTDSNLKESSSKSQKGIKKNYSEVEKQEIIAGFDKLKKEFKTRTKGMSYNMKKIDKKIARTFGVSRATINNWKKQFGVSKKQKKHTDAEKVELSRNFHKIKKENPQLRKDKIAQMLNIHIKTLNIWGKKGLKPGVIKIYSKVEKQEIIAEFDELKKNFKTRAKGMSYDMKKIEKKIAQKLGVSRSTTNIWKTQLGIPKTKKKHTEAEKAKFLNQFYKIEEENPQMYKEKIAQKLNVPLRTINFWKRQFLNKVGNGGPIDNVQQNGGSARSTSSANSLNGIPWKWNDFGKKRNKRIEKILNKC